MLQPEQGKADQGKPDVGVEDHTRIPWRKVVRSDYLDYVTGCRTPQEAGGTYNCGSAHVEATPEPPEARRSRSPDLRNQPPSGMDCLPNR